MSTIPVTITFRPPELDVIAELTVDGAAVPGPTFDVPRSRGHIAIVARVPGYRDNTSIVELPASADRVIVVIAMQPHRRSYRGWVAGAVVGIAVVVVALWRRSR